MMENYKVGYSADALDDLREIYTYIANELLVPETAAAQVGRIRKEVRSLDFMPARYALVEWEPWHSMKMHQLSVDNFIVYYLVDDKEMAVTVVRVFYNGRDIAGIINSNSAPIGINVVDTRMQI
jgi:toxin ParE1/3/4